MTYKVIIQPPALDDIEATYLYLAERSPSAANRWLDEMLEAIDSLADFPQRCGIAPESVEFDDEIRQRLVGRRPHIHRILFVIRGTAVRILHVRHSARQK